MPTTEEAPPLTEEIAVRAMRAARLEPTPERVEKAKAIRDEWTRRSEAAGRDPWAETKRRKQEEDAALRRLYQDRQTHGMDPETLSRIDRTLGQFGNRYEVFNEQFLTRALGIPKEAARSGRKDFLRAYSGKFFGEEIGDDAAFAARLGDQFDLEDRIAEKATAAAVGAMAPLDALAKLDAEERENPIYAARTKEQRDQFAGIAGAASRRLAPHRAAVAEVSEILKEAMGVREQGETEEFRGARGRTFTREAEPLDISGESYRTLARRIMEVPKEDRNLVLAAIAATAGEDRKGVMAKLAESFGRGVEDYFEGIPAQMERGPLTLLRAQVSQGGAVEGDASTVEGYIRGINIRLARAGDPSGFAGIAGILDSEPKSEPTPEVRRDALALVDEAIEAVDMRGRLRQIAENDLDPIASDSMAMRGLYAAARSAPFTLAAMAPGGFFLNSAVMAEHSYQALRAANPDMDASTAQGIAMFAGPAQGALERVSAGVLTGRLPAFKRWANQPILTGRAVAARGAARLTGAAGIEMVQENLQDAVPFLAQSALAALSEDVPDVPWSEIYGDLAEQQGELFFAVLPLILIGAGVGTVRDYRGSDKLMQSAELLRAARVSEADASEIRAKAIAGDVDGAQAELRRAFAEGGQDQQEIAATIAAAVPELRAERDRIAKAVAAGQDLDILPAIERTDDGYSLHFDDGSAMSFPTYDEAADRMEQIGRESVLRLHEDVIGSIRKISAGIETGRGLRYLFNPGAPVVRDAVDEGTLTEEGGRAAVGIAKTINPEARKEFETARVEADLAAAGRDDALATTRILGSSANEFVDGVVWTTMRFYQSFTAETVLEEKFEGDAKWMIDQLGLRKWMIGAFREWEAVTGDKLLVTADDAAITNRNLVEAWSAMGRAWFISGNEGRGLTRAKMEKLMRTHLAGPLTGYAALFAATLRRAALVEQAVADGTLDRRNLAGIAEMLDRYSGLSEQQSFERAVEREAGEIAAQIAPEMRDNAGSDSPMAETTFSTLPSRVTPEMDAEYLAAVEAGDMDTAQRMVEQSEEAPELTGWRLVEGTVTPGEPLEPSRVHKPNEFGEWIPTEEFTNGVSTFRKWRDAEKYSRYSGKGFTLVLVGGGSGRLPEGDPGLPGEAVITDAKALATFTREDFRNPWVKSADPVTYDANGNVIPLSQRFNPDRDEITFSLAPGDLNARIERMFSPFQRSPELRAAVWKDARRRIAALETVLAPIVRANRTKKSIAAERKQRQEELFTDKLERIGSGTFDALSAASIADDSARPILTELLRQRVGTRKDGKTFRYWTGSLMSKAEAARRGIETEGKGEWDDIPEGLPPYVWGGSITPDQAAQMFGFERVSDFWDALASEIASWNARKQEAADAAADIAQARTEAREEAMEWERQALKQRETVGSDRNTLLGFLRTLDAVTRSLPIEIRGRVGGSVALARLATPAAMLDEIESRMEKADRELERWMRKEANKRREKLFKRDEPKRESGKKPKGKVGADIHSLFDTLRDAIFWDGDKAETHATGLEAAIAKGELSAEQEAHNKHEANLVRLFADWKNSDAARRIAAVEAAEEVFREGYMREKERVAAERERRQAARAEIRANLGTLGERSERARKAQQDAGLSGKLKAGFISLFDFERVAGFALGEGSKWQRWFADRQRAADFQMTDEVQAVVESVETLFRDLAGGRALEGEKLQWRLSQPSMDTTQGGKLSPLEGVTALLMWRQEDGKRHMRGRRDEDGNVTSEWSYDETFIREIEEALPEEAWAVHDWLVKNYAGEWEQINPLFRKLNGIDLPKNDKYSPLTVDPAQSPGNAAVDPLTQQTVSGTSATPGSFRTRAQTIAEPRFVDAIQVYIAHKKQIAHWKAYAELNTEARAILGTREIRNSIEAASGQEAAKVLGAWLDYFALGGFREAGRHLQTWSLLSEITGRAAAVQLVGRIGTLAIQATQLGAASAKMPLGSYVSRLGKLLSGQLNWKAALDSAYIQRRMKQMPPAVRIAMEGLRASEPNAVKHAARRVGWLLSGTDGLFTAGTYAIVHDYQATQYRRGGLDRETADRLAHQDAERIVDEIAQPVRAGTRSIFELTSSGNPLAKAGWAFASEARKNFALLVYSALKRTPTEAARAALFTIVINGAFAAVIRNAWRDMRDDDDEEVFDERHWGVRKLLLSAATEWLYGFPLLGEAAQEAVFAAAGQWMPSGGIVSVKNAPRALARAPENLGKLLEGDLEQPLRDLETILMAAGLANETIAGYASFSHLLRDAEALLRNATSDRP